MERSLSPIKNDWLSLHVINTLVNHANDVLERPKTLCPHSQGLEGQVLELSENHLAPEEQEWVQSKFQDSLVLKLENISKVPKSGSQQMLPTSCRSADYWDSGALICGRQSTARQRRQPKNKVQTWWRGSQIHSETCVFPYFYAMALHPTKCRCFPSNCCSLWSRFLRAQWGRGSWSGRLY